MPLVLNNHYLVEKEARPNGGFTAAVAPPLTVPRPRDCGGREAEQGAAAAGEPGAAGGAGVPRVPGPGGGEHHSRY